MATADYPRAYGSYLLLERLGQGGMSEVELARRAVNDAAYVRFLVIKRIHPRHTGDEEFVKMFQDEARINAELQHENIAQVYDFGRVEDEWFLAMEYVPGKDLRDIQTVLAERGERVPLRMTLRVLAEVLSALQYAHSRVDTYGRPMRIVHRDVNPRNVMLSVRGEVKLIDFGVAKADTKAEQTVGHAIKGKFAYMAPEQIEGAAQLDGRADLFAVGLMLHELVTGSSPFLGLTEVQIMHRILGARIPPLEAVPGHPEPDLVRAIHRRVLSQDRDQRYPDAAAMRRDVERAAAPLGGLCTQQELAAFVHGVDPSAADAISRRLRAWREVDRAPLAAAIPVHPPIPAGDGSISRSYATLDAEIEAAERARAVRRWAAIAAATLVAGALALAVLAGVMGVLGAWFVSREEAAPVAAAPVRGATEADPARVRPAERAPAKEPVEAPGPSALPAAPVRSRTAEAPPPEASVPPPEVAPPPAAEDPPPVESEPEAVEPPEQPPPVATVSTPPAEPTSFGYLYASSSPSRGYEVLVDGARVGTTPIKNLRVPEGRHEVVIRDPATGRSWNQTVTVQPGKPTVVSTSP